jgi:hypothetical protein
LQTEPTESHQDADEPAERAFKLKFLIVDEVAASLIGTEGAMKKEIEVITLAANFSLNAMFHSPKGIGC